MNKIDMVSIMRHKQYLYNDHLYYSLGGMTEISRPNMHKDKLQLVDLLYTLFNDSRQNPDRESIL